MSKSDAFLLLTVALIPIQLGKFFFRDYSFVLGIPLDYRAQTIYLSDITLILYITFFAFDKKMRKLLINSNIDSRLLFMLGLFIFYLFTNSIFASISREASLFFSLKITLFAVFSIFASVSLIKPTVQNLASKIILFSISWQLLLTTSQLITGRSVGLWILGERAYSSSTSQIAHIDFFGKQLTRPYGTFSHPNVLGAFLAIFMVLIDITMKGIKNSQVFKIICALGIFMSFSKSALIALVTYFFITEKTRIAKIIFIASFFALTYFFINFLGQNQIFSIAERLQLIQASIEMASENTLFGTGANNFILELSKLNLISIAQTRLLQPVHNLFLLVLVELGFIGLSLFMIFLYFVSAGLKNEKKQALFIILLAMASFDHFFWTIQQGQLLFWFSLAFLINSPKNTSS